MPNLRRLDPTRLTARERWSVFSPCFKALACAGPGIQPARNMVKHIDRLLPFSEATIILDIGCGPEAQITRAVLELFRHSLPHGTRLIAADKDTTILQSTRARLAIESAQDPAWNMVEACDMDVAYMEELADNSVSHVMAGFMLFALADPLPALREIRRVLAPNGVFAASSFASSEWHDLSRFLLQVKLDQTLPPLPQSWSSEASVQALLARAGFSHVETELSPTHMPFTSHDEMCRFLLFRMPLNGAIISNMTDEEIRETLLRMNNHLKATHPSLPNQLRGTAVIGFGRKA